ncbi:MAG: porin family protein [Muribaculaceae bacterium]|nr:porin family protein [Muribaculaceae bacterium]
MTRTISRILMTLVAAMAIGLSARSQVADYKYDLGLELGMSGYLGDANGSNIFKHPGLAASVTGRYIANVRWDIRVNLGMLKLSGNTDDYAMVLPGDAHYKFSSSVYELGGRFEFNFFPYGIGETYKHLRRWTPYAALGIGFSVASCDGPTSFAPNIPMAVGVKYKLRERWNLGVEFSMTKVFGDKIDGNLTDLYGIKSSFAKNTDWYSRLAVSVSYEFGKRCVTCHYVD